MPNHEKSTRTPTVARSASARARKFNEKPSRLQADYNKLDNNSLLEDFGQRPRHGLGNRTSFRDFDLVTDTGRIGSVMHMVLLAAHDNLAVKRCLTRRSTRTVTVLSILSLVTTPTRVRVSFLVSTVSVISRPPSEREPCERARYLDASCATDSNSGVAA